MVISLRCVSGYRGHAVAWAWGMGAVGVVEVQFTKPEEGYRFCVSSGIAMSLHGPRWGSVE